MPYSIRRAGGKFQVISSDTGKVHGTHPTQENAQAQLRAMYANAPPGSEKSKPKKKTSHAWTQEYMIRGRRK